MINTLRLKTLAKQFLLFTVLAMLVACAADEEPSQNSEPVVNAATAEPCEEQYQFQRELNGVPDDTHVETSEANGAVITTEKHWYADAGMIVFFAYASGQNWCNVWNEGGVSWRH